MKYSYVIFIAIITAALTQSVPQPCPCGNTNLQLDKNQFNQLKSPKFSNSSSYCPNAYCVYTITAAESQIVFLQFFHFNVEPNYDWVNIYDGPIVDVTTKLASLSGFNYTEQHPGWLWYSSGRTMTVEFSSDLTIEYGGYFANYQSIDTVTTPTTSAYYTTPPYWCNSPYDFSCNFFSNGTQLGWMDAENYCKNYCGKMTVLESSNDWNQKYVPYLQNTSEQYVWVSNYQIDNGSIYSVWNTDQPLLYSNWNLGHPVAPELCIAADTKSGLWYAQSCDEKLNFLCSKDPFLPIYCDIGNNP